MSKLKMRENENEYTGGAEFHKRAKRAVDKLRVGSILTLDLNGYYLDSCVIGILISIYTSCVKKDIEMELINMSPETSGIFALSGLDKIIDIIPSENKRR